MWCGSHVIPGKNVCFACDNVQVLLGAKTINDHINVDDYLKFGHFYYTTEDGSREKEDLLPIIRFLRSSSVNLPESIPVAPIL
jgi:hypothetical protein